MPNHPFLYFFNYDKTEYELCMLEARSIFNEEVKNKLLFTDLKIEPSCSSFIKKRLDIISYSTDYTTLINEIKSQHIYCEGFKIEYLVLDGDTTDYATRLEKLRETGYSIEGNTDYYNPTTTYALCLCQGIWYFAASIRNDLIWHKHVQKPHTYSNSISVNIAKALINIAANADKSKSLLDACCGVGTILLEACFAGFNIVGCDINQRIVYGAQKNLAHFNYSANVHCADIKDITQKYDAAIIDLPYNLYSFASEEDIQHIIASTSVISDRLVIVSIADISELINGIGFNIIDFCTVNKRGKSSFARKIWVCEKGSCKI